MSKRIVFLLLAACLAVGFASSAAAASTWKRLGGNPFYPPSLNSEADLALLVKSQGVALETGFTKAGYPELYPSFMEQFPTAKIDSVKVAPGETFEWILFKRKSSGRVAVLKDVTWVGAEPFYAYRFTIDKDGKRHEFVVPYVCGNVSLRSVSPIPPPVAIVAPAPPPAVAPPPPPPPPPPPVVAPQVAVAAPAPVKPPPPPPVAPKPVVVPVAPAPVVVPPVAAPVDEPRGGFLFDVGLARQLDPANYAFARIGYEVPLAENLYLIGLVGGSLRWMGNDGGSAFTVDALLDYHWLGGVSFDLGAGYWSGNGGQVDLIADLGFLLGDFPDGGDYSLFLETRLPVDHLGDVNEFGRIGLGLRFRL